MLGADVLSQLSFIGQAWRFCSSIDASQCRCDSEMPGGAQSVLVYILVRYTRTVSLICCRGYLISLSLYRSAVGTPQA